MKDLLRMSDMDTAHKQETHDLSVQRLEEHADKALDLSYDVPHINERQFWCSLRGVLAALLADLDASNAADQTGSTAEEETRTLKSIDVVLKFCTRSLARGKVVQDHAYHTGIYHDFIKCIQIDADRAYGALSNLVTKNPDLVRTVQQATFECQSGSTKVAKTFCTNMLLFLRNSIKSSDHVQHLAHCFQIINSTHFMYLFRRPVTSRYAVDESTHQSLGRICCNTFVAAGLISECFIKIRSIEGDDGSSVSWRIFSAYVADDCQNYLGDGPLPDHVSSMCLTLARQLHDIAEQLPSALVALSSCSTPPVTSMESFHFSRIENIWAITGHLLHVLAESTSTQTNRFRLTSLVPDVLKILELAELHSPKAKAGRQTLTQSFIPRGLKRDCVALIAHMTYRDKAIQDTVRECGGLPLILAQSHIDDANPYLLEQTTVCINFLLDGNKKNQDIIAGMKPIAVQQDNELSQFGYSAQVVDGKVKLSRADKITEI